MLDEPNSSLDFAGEQALLNAIQAFREAGSIPGVDRTSPALARADEIFGDREEVLAKLNPLTAADSLPQQQRKAAACA